MPSHDPGHLASASASMRGKARSSAQQMTCHPPSRRDSRPPSAYPYPHTTIESMSNPSPRSEKPPPPARANPATRALPVTENTQKAGLVRSPPRSTPNIAVRIEEELVLVTDPSAGLLSSAKALRDRTILVFHSGCSYRARFEDWLRHEGIVPEKVMEFGTLDGIIGCAAAGLGVALLPRSTVEKHVRDHLVAGHPIPDPFGKVQTVFIYRNEEYLPAPLKKMIELLNDGQRTDGGIAHGHGTG